VEIGQRLVGMPVTMRGPRTARRAADVSVERIVADDWDDVLSPPAVAGLNEPDDVELLGDAIVCCSVSAKRTPARVCVTPVRWTCPSGASGLDRPRIARPAC